MADRSVATIIPTLDEEIHVARVVRSARDLGSVFVVDAESSDRTREIALAEGANVVTHEWKGYSAQKNWALSNLPLDSRWVLFLDADEYLSSGLRSEIRTATASSRYDGYYLPRRNIFLGRDLRHVWWYPDYQMRLFLRDGGRFEDRSVHEHAIVIGDTSFLREPLWHENLKGIDAFIDRHCRYAAWEAAEILRAAENRPRFHWRHMFVSPQARRRMLKQMVWYRLPWRPAFRFAWLYFVRRGFLDGKAGLVYAQLIAAYEAMIDAKLLEAVATARPAMAQPRGEVAGAYAREESG